MRSQYPTYIVAVPPKSQSRKAYLNRKQQEQPLSGLDVNALLSSGPSAKKAKKAKITPENAVPEFKRIAMNADNVEGIKDAVSQFGGIISTWVTHSLGDSEYQRALEALGTMREECIQVEEPEIFNAFLRNFKKALAGGGLGGDRREMWAVLRSGRAGLIDKRASPHSGVSEEEARQVIPLRSDIELVPIFANGSGSSYDL